MPIRPFCRPSIWCWKWCHQPFQLCIRILRHLILITIDHLFINSSAKGRRFSILGCGSNVCIVFVPLPYKNTYIQTKRQFWLLIKCFDGVSHERLVYGTFQGKRAKSLGPTRILYTRRRDGQGNERCANMKKYQKHPLFFICNVRHLEVAMISSVVGGSDCS